MLHNTKLPLTVWFWAAYLMTTDTRGISALLLQRQLGLRRYETAWMLLHKLRRAMVNLAREPLHGEMEIDNTWAGGAQPPGYRRQKPIRCPKLEAFTGVIDQILRDDQHRPKKQRHTAKRICERLRAEHDFTGSYTIVKSLRARAEAGRARDVCAARASICPALSRFVPHPKTFGRPQTTRSDTVGGGEHVPVGRETLPPGRAHLACGGGF